MYVLLHKRLLASLIVSALAFSFVNAEDSKEVSCDVKILGKSKVISSETAKEFYSTKTWKFFNFIKSLRYKVTVKGLEDVNPSDTKSTLFLMAHEGYIDPVIASSILGAKYGVRPLMDEGQLGIPVIGNFLGWLGDKVGTLVVPESKTGVVRSRKSVDKLVDNAVVALNAGDNLLIYPSGTLKKAAYEDLGSKSIIEKILKERPGTRIIMGRYQGLWGSVWTFGGQPSNKSKVLNFKKAIFTSMDTLISNLFYVPERPVTVTFKEAEGLSAEMGRVQINKYIEDFFNKEKIERTHVGHYWLNRKPKVLPEPDRSSDKKHIEIKIDAKNKAIADKIIKENIESEETYTQATELKNLGVDSLNFMSLMMSLEAEFDIGVDGERVETVGDVYAIATGESDAIVQKRIETSKAWNALPESKKILELSTGESVAELFLRQALRNPKLAIAEDEISGVLSYRKLLIAVFLMSEKIKKMPGENIGIMLPPSVGSLVMYLSTTFAGKVPVMVNFTAGDRSILHSMNGTDVESIITSSQFIDKLDKKDLSFDSIFDRFVFVEDIKEQVTKADKLSAATEAYLNPRSLLRRNIQPTAVILFSSGSEADPKTIEITQEMMLTNLRGVLEHFEINRSDRIVNFLPPFHSFGHLVMLISATLGVPSVYYPDATNGRAIGETIGAYKPTIILGVPTFYKNIYTRTEPENLQSLRLGLSGASPLTSEVNDLIQQVTPNLELLEGYGVTEASPVITLNRPGKQEFGTVGTPLNNVDLLIVDLVNYQPVPNGEQGLIVARGKNFMKAYRNQTPEQDPWVEVPGQGGWYSTGDLGYLKKSGNLVINGRLKRTIKIAGEMTSLESLEASLGQLLLDKEQEQNIESDGGLFVVEATRKIDDPNVVLFTILDGVSVEEVNRTLKEAGHPGRERVNEVRKVDFIPVTGPGKVDWKIFMKLLTEELEAG